MNLKSILQEAARQGASDVHLVTGLPPGLRVAGEIIMHGDEPLTETDIRGMIDPLLNEELRREYDEKWQLCFSTYLEEVAHVRVSVYSRLGRMEAAIRLRALEIRTLEELGLPPAVAELTRKPNGLVLITGPTGVGKTTTFYSMVDLVNREQRKKVITVEDPIEYLHEHKRSVVIQQEVDRDAKDFPSALMHILRLDPDIICIGEMRDAETISTALLAAETGHLVIATLHTTSAAQTLERILTAVPLTERGGIAVQLANCLRGVVTQALLPTVDRKSRALVCEVMLASTAIRNLIREMKLTGINDAIQSGASDGMLSVDMSLKELYQGGRISYDTAMTYARDPQVVAPRRGDKKKPAKTA